MHSCFLVWDPKKREICRKRLEMQWHTTTLVNPYSSKSLSLFEVCFNFVQ